MIYEPIVLPTMLMTSAEVELLEAFQGTNRFERGIWDCLTLPFQR